NGRGTSDFLHRHLGWPKPEGEGRRTRGPARQVTSRPQASGSGRSRVQELTMRRYRAIALGCLASCLAGPSPAEDRVARFDRDPAWDGVNNRAAAPEPGAIRQDFGYSRTAHAGGEPGEIGGFLSPAAEPAYFAKAIPAATLDNT